MHAAHGTWLVICLWIGHRSSALESKEHWRASWCGFPILNEPGGDPSFLHFLSFEVEV
jgi:hypothetical protein